MAMVSAPRLKFDRVNECKANFDRIYSEPDPREYYRVLFGLDYIIPDLAKGIFRDIISHLTEQKGRPIRVLDVGCSYGINAALIRHPLDIDRIAQRYLDLQSASLTTPEIIELDRKYFGSWPKMDVEIIGCDVSKPAIDYAIAAGLITHGIVGDFESQSISPAAQAHLQGVDLIISTGCIGYVTEKTFSKLLHAIGAPAPWVASFVLRMFPYAGMAALLDGAGLATEKFPGVTFVQRRFRSKIECTEIINSLEAQGIDTTNKEDDGLLHAEFFLSRPPNAMAGAPLEDILSVTSGVSRASGHRLRRGEDNVLR